MAGELQPVHDGLPPETAALAQALRDLFAGLNLTTRRYAARRSYDSSTVSRYLSGQRLPRWEFVLNLLNDVSEARGATPTGEAVDMLRTLHTAAWQTGNSPVHRVHLLERKLADADREAQRAAARERWLQDTLEDREQRIRDLGLRYRELQAGAAATEAVDADGEPANEHVRLRAEIRDLKDELARVRALHREAEERCERLERELVETERTAVLNGAPLLPATREHIDGGLDVRDTSGRRSSPTFHFGHVNGGVNVVSDSWQVDEEFVSSMTVWLQIPDRDVRNGLLVDADTVVTFDWQPPARDSPVTVGVGEKSVRGTLVEELPVAGSSDTTVTLMVLRLSEPVPVPDRPLTCDARVMPGTRLVVGARTRAGTGYFSCLLELKGRSGIWLRVSGDTIDGLAGAPVFSSAGSLVGMVAYRSSDTNGSLLLPVSALRELTTLDLDI
ncbi:hypothetical protein OG444_02765 [Streptomyces sp. NBC_01232]|uniref:hypothetical protein n=1 Tax=Streptomyces sp. NBC_01232 TaxID=2903786 RepID=UPI002E10D1F5|nr:hypothetical protein OG444_02765 [Streptomyces sp. NBC_01232]